MHVLRDSYESGGNLEIKMSNNNITHSEDSSLLFVGLSHCEDM